MRTGVILDKRGGALKPLLPLFKAGLGGPVGSAASSTSRRISLTDWVRAATHLATHDEAAGRLQRVRRRSATTNAEFGRAARPDAAPSRGGAGAGAGAIRSVIGTVSSELLNSTRVEPARLLAEGFTFEHPTLDEQLAAALT